MKFDRGILTAEDRLLAWGILDDRKLQFPDLVIAPDGKPYLYRWHIVHQQKHANVYFHIQVASDPERPLHDHPWDNTSVILSGGYDEIWKPKPWWDCCDHTRRLRKGDVVHRLASEAHRLILPPEIPYTMSLFTTGPKVREWGFWFEDGWRPYTDVTKTENGVSIHVKPDTKR